MKIPEIEADDFSHMVEFTKQNGLPDLINSNPSDINWDDIAKKITKIRTEQSQTQKNQLNRNDISAKRRVLAKWWPLSDKVKGWIWLVIIVLLIILII